MFMNDLPRSVTIQEEGPREGFQSEAAVSLPDKLRLIEALAETGLKQINCVSFVDPRRVPQMADADDVARRLRRRNDVRYTGIWLNARGFERALTSGLDLDANVVISVSDTFSRKNNGCGKDELIRAQGLMIERYHAVGLPLEAAHVFTAFGCHYEGAISPENCVDTLKELLLVCADHDAIPRTVYLCDTTGSANPRQIQRVLGLARSRWPDQEFALHLHDTRGTGIANALAGLEMGVARFDASVGGMGGCPFAGNSGAAGNICTEDLANMCEEMGIATGIDLPALSDCARMAESIVGHALPGKLMRSGYRGHARGGKSRDR